MHRASLVKRSKTVEYYQVKKEKKVLFATFLFFRMNSIDLYTSPMYLINLLSYNIYSSQKYN